MPLTTIPIHSRDQKKPPFCYTIVAGYGYTAKMFMMMMMMMTTTGGAAFDSDYYYGEEWEEGEDGSKEALPPPALADSNPIKIGHTFEMLPHPNIDKYGMSPLPLDYRDIENLHNEREAWGLVSPPHSAVVYRLHDIHTVFLALLLIQVGPRSATADIGTDTCA